VSELGLSIVDSAIQADQAELQTSAENIANAQTPGYARETVQLGAYYPAEPNGVGGGVQTLGVSQMASGLLDANLRAAQAANGYATEMQTITSSVENLFPEPSQSGLQAQLSHLWSDLTKLAADPGSQALDQTVVTDAQTVTSTLNQTANGLGQLTSQLETELGAPSASSSGILVEANQLLSEVASLNTQITAGQGGGQDTNALIDQRRADLSQLATLVGTTTRQESNGSMTVWLGGVTLVENGTAESLQATGGGGTTPLGVQTSLGTPVEPGGQAGAILEAVNTTIPGIQSQLDGVAAALAGQLNTLQAAGLDASGLQQATTFFTGTTASTIALNPSLVANPTWLATAAGPPANPLGTPTLDGSNAAQMAAVANAPGGPDQLYQALVGDVGTLAQAASGQATTATTIETQAKSAVENVSGVSTNNEALVAMQAEKAFEAASKVAGTIAQALDSLLAAV
jgi:flagellar hook-associated protein 1 FlgK